MLPPTGGAFFVLTFSTIDLGVCFPQSDLDSDGTSRGLGLSVIATGLL
jgi:hypothetical protein